jgi:predicted dehydrogenase
MIRVGIIGTGLIAKEHALALSLLKDVARLAAAADVDVARLEAFITLHAPIRCYEEPMKLIEDPEVDLVAITTPPAAHEELVTAALEKGKFVFCEKPLAHSLASAARIAEMERRHSGRLTVSYQLRCDPYYRRLLWLCRNGWVGEIQSARIERHSYIPRTNLGTGWWGSWNVAGGGVLITQLIHELDLLLQIMGRAAAVSASMDTRYTGIESEDYVEATVRFESGAIAHCVASVNSGRTGGSFTIHGSKGAVGLPFQFTTKDQALVRKATAELDKALPETRPPASSFMTRGFRFAKRRLGVAAKPELTAHARVYEKIARSVEKSEPLPIPPSEAMGSLELCFAAYESAITGKEIRLPLSSFSPVYGGVLKADYDGRKCSWSQPERKGSQLVKVNRKYVGLQVGLIGLDTSHAPSFASILHDPDNPFHIPGAKVAAAYPGGSTDMPISISRVGGFTSELRDKYGVRMMDSPEAVAEACDMVCIVASDGRTHPALLRAVAGRCPAVFVDKPLAVSFADAQAMMTLAAEKGTRVFASSAFRYADGLANALNAIRAAGERVKSCRVRYWLQIQETQGRYFWYGIHASEMMFAIMGKGACEVEVSHSGDQDTILVTHEDGRRSALVGSQSDGTFHVRIETDRRIVEVDLGPSNASLAARVLAAALDVLSEGQFPRLWSATAAGSVSGGRAGRLWDPDGEETLEVIGVLDAAQRSYTSKQRIAVERAAVPLSP